MSIPVKFKSSKEAKQAGFFSRRHQNSKARDEAKEKHRAKKGYLKKDK